jgi:hypothetical protein
LAFLNKKVEGEKKVMASNACRAEQYATRLP